MEPDQLQKVLSFLLLSLLVTLLGIGVGSLGSKDAAERKYYSWCLHVGVVVVVYIFFALLASFDGHHAVMYFLVGLPIVLLLLACAVAFFIVVGKAVAQSVAKAEDRLAKSSPAFNRALVQGSKLKRDHLVLLVMIGWSIFAVAATVWVVWYVNHKQVNDPGRAFLLFLGILATNGILLWLNVLAHQNRLRRSAALAADLLPAVNLLATPGLLGVWYFTQIHAP